MHMKKIIALLCSLFFLTGCITINNNTEITGNSESDKNENSAPSITGSPDLTVENNSYYRFLPVASDTDDDSLTFSITNKPEWASFDTTTGELYGTPEQAIEYKDITISVSDGINTSQLDSFDISVTAELQFDIQISWEKPLENIDGSLLDNISKYKIVYGEASDNMENSVYFDSDTTIGTIENLSTGNYFFKMITITKSEIESDMSETFYFNVSN